MLKTSQSRDNKCDRKEKASGVRKNPHFEFRFIALGRA